MYWVHLHSAQNAGLKFWQTGSDAIITYPSVAKECVVKVVSESGKREMFDRQLTPRGPKVTLREKWVHRSSNALRLPRETEKKLQIWDSNPIPSESHLAEGGVLNTLLIFESTASLTMKLTRTSSTCKELQNKFRNLYIRKKLFKKEDPLGDNILSETAAKKICEAGYFELHEVQKRTDKVQLHR